MTDTVQWVERHIIPRDDPRWFVLDQACFRGKNVYNAALYQTRQAFFHENRYIPYREQEKCFKEKDLLEDQRLPLKVVQQLLMQIHNEWKSFFEAVRAFGSAPEKFKARPRPPYYKHKVNGRATLTFTTQAISRTALRKGIITLTALGVSVPTRAHNVNQVRVVPRANHIVIEVVYTRNIEQYDFGSDVYAAVDIGLNTLAALTSNKPGFRPTLVNGRPLKSINQYYNKLRAIWTSRLPVGQHTSRRIQAMTGKRNRRIEYQLHVASRYLIEILKRERIGVLVIGKNDGWKQNVDLGKRTNQHFTAIPHARFIHMLQYKAEQVGIRVILTEESYTSKCSFLDDEPIGKQETYRGKRVKRGLFRASDGKAINADLNGSYNILRKIYPDAYRGLTEVALHGVKVASNVIEKHLRTWGISHNGRRGAKRRNCIRSAPVGGTAPTNFEALE